MLKFTKTNAVIATVLVLGYFLISLKAFFLKDVAHSSIQACESPFEGVVSNTTENLNYYIDLAKKSEAVYDNKARSLAFLEHCDKECTISINGGATVQITYKSDDDTVYLVFKGTSNNEEVKADLNQHLGIAPPYYSKTNYLVAQILTKYEPENIVLAGHSLGGALAFYVGLQWHGTNYKDVSVVTFNPLILHQNLLVSKMDALQGLAKNTFNFVIDGDVASTTVSGTNVFKLQGYTFVLEPISYFSGKHAIKTVINTLEQYNLKVSKKKSICEAYRGNNSIISHKN